MNLNERFFDRHKLVRGIKLEDCVILSAHINDSTGEVVTVSRDPNSDTVLIKNTYKAKKENLEDDQNFFKLILDSSKTLEYGPATDEKFTRYSEMLRARGL